jgi:hypothetical protein
MGLDINTPREESQQKGRTMTNVETTTATNGKGKGGGGGRVPPNETREEKFVRLATARIGVVKSKIRLIKNLAHYPHTEEQAAKIVAELNKMAADIEAAFNPRRDDDTFSF